MHGLEINAVVRLLDLLVIQSNMFVKMPFNTFVERQSIYNDKVLLDIQEEYGLMHCLCFRSKDI